MYNTTTSKPIGAEPVRAIAIPEALESLHCNLGTACELLSLLRDRLGKVSTGFADMPPAEPPKPTSASPIRESVENASQRVGDITSMLRQLLDVLDL